jgi:hypothetical protein
MLCLSDNTERSGTKDNILLIISHLTVVSSSTCLASNEGIFSKHIIPNDAKEAVAT